MGKWEEIIELEVEDLEDMVYFSAKDLSWTKIWGDQVAIIPYYRLEDVIIGVQVRETAPTQFVVHTLGTRKLRRLQILISIHFGVCYVSIYSYS